MLLGAGVCIIENLKPSRVEASLYASSACPSKWSKRWGPYLRRLSAGAVKGEKGMIRQVMTFVVSGGLTARYLMPALVTLYQAGQLPEGFRVLGIARADWSEA